MGGDTLLNIPPCSMAEEPGEQSQSLSGLTTQTIQEEAKAASTEECALQLRGTDFYLPLGGQPRILE